MADTENKEKLSDPKSDMTKWNKSLDDFNKDHITSTKSIIKRTKDSIFYFPVYCSKSLTINEAHALAKMLERVYADFVQNAIYNERLVDAEDLKGMKFLKNIHTNIIDENTKCLDHLLGSEPLDLTEQMIYNSCYNILKTHNGYVRFVESDEMFKDRYFVAEHSRLIEDPLKGLYYLSEDQNDKKPYSRNKAVSDRNKINQLEDDIDNLERKIKDDEAFEADYKLWTNNKMSDTHMKEKYFKKLKADINKEEGHKKLKDEIEKKKAYIDAKKSEKVESLKNKKLEIDKLEQNIHDVEVDDKKKKDNEKIVSNQSKIFSRDVKLLKDTDVQKINSMLPYNITVTIGVKVADNNIVEQTIQIGIKTVLHLVSYEDLQSELPSIFKGSKNKFDFIRLKTGELNWFQWLFQANKNKEEAKRNVKNKTWVTTLKKLAKYKDTYGGSFKDAIPILTGFKRSRAPIPNATMILTSIDVDNIKLNTGIDLTQVKNVKTLAQNMFLITFVIMDPSTRTLKTLYPDSENSWNTHALDAIEDLVSKSSNVDFMRELKKSINR